MLKAGIIGLGSMGLPMAKHMVSKGFEVYGYDVAEQARVAAADAGIEVIRTLPELGEKTDVVVIMVQTDQQVEDIIRNSGLVTSMAEQSVICIASSVSSFICKELESLTKEWGIGLLDTPVVLGQEAANNGTLTVFVGGEERWLKKAEPLLASFGQKIFHIGGIGCGQIAKTANNLLLWTCLVGNYEVLSLAKNLDVDVPRLIEALMHSSGANWSLSRWGKSTGKWAEKDMDVALDLAQKVKTPVPLCGLVDQLVKGINQEKMRSLLT